MELELSFGEYVRRRLRQQGLSVTDAARRGGFSRQSLNNWIKGDVKRIHLANIIRLAKVLEVTPYYCLQRLCKELSINIQSDGCGHYANDHTSFLSDVTYPDNSVVTVGAVFEKRWSLQNSGSITWNNRYLVCTDTDCGFTLNDMTAACLEPFERRVPVPVTDSGETCIVSVTFRAPDLPGTVRSHWVMVDSEGNRCFPDNAGYWCQVKVLRI